MAICCRHVGLVGQEPFSNKMIHLLSRSLLDYCDRPMEHIIVLRRYSRKTNQPESDALMV